MKNAGNSEELGHKDDLTAKEAGIHPASLIYVSRLEQDSLLQLDISTAIRAVLSGGHPTCQWPGLNVTAIVCGPSTFLKVTT